MSEQRSWLSDQEARVQFAIHLAHEAAMDALHESGITDDKIDICNQLLKERTGADLSKPAAWACQRFFHLTGTCELEIGETLVFNPRTEHPFFQEWGTQGFDDILMSSGAFSRYVRPVMDRDIEESGGLGFTTSGAIGKVPNYILVTTEDEGETYDTEPVWISPDHIDRYAEGGK
jgi:hypothetical protein